MNGAWREVPGTSRLQERSPRKCFWFGFCQGWFVYSPAVPASNAVVFKWEGKNSSRSGETKRRGARAWRLTRLRSAEREETGRSAQRPESFSGGAPSCPSLFLPASRQMSVVIDKVVAFPLRFFASRAFQALNPGSRNCLHPFVRISRNAGGRPLLGLGSWTPLVRRDENASV